MSKWSFVKVSIYEVLQYFTQVQSAFLIAMLISIRLFMMRLIMALSDTSERIYFTRICTPLNRTKQILAESQGNYAKSAWKHCSNRMPIGISMT